MYTKEEIKNIEKAIEYLIYEYKKTGHNPKPVVFHSLRIAYKLVELNYSTEIIIGAILHDLLEDSKVKSDDITKSFNIRISQLVQSLSFDSSMEDTVERYKELFERVVNYGFDSAVIKCADLLDNSNYYSLAPSKEKKTELIGKVGYFLDISKNLIGNEKIWMSLKERYDDLIDQG